MIRKREELAREYASALKTHLSGGGEEGLKGAYDLGRRAVNDGTGLVKIVLLHQQALDPIVRKFAATQRVRTVRRAMEFLAECLAPFDMAYRGFQDAYDRVRELNEEFEELAGERAREARNAEARFRAHVEQVPAITYLESLKTGEFVYISPQVQPMLEYTPQEWLDEPGRWARQVHPGDRDRMLAEMTRFRDRGGALKAEYRMLARSGREVWVRHEATCVLDEAGRPRFIQGVILETTERRAAEHKARESEALFRRLFERAGDAVVVASWPGVRILAANEASAKLFGTTVKKLESRTFTDLFAGGSEPLRAHLERAVAKGEAGPDRIAGAVPIRLSSTVVDRAGERALLVVARRDVGVT